MSNNHKNFACPFAEQLVSYLYGEADPLENHNFTAHLENCSACADDLASFGFVRASVSDWRAAEFAQLPTPNFSLPALHSGKTFSDRAALNENQSWFAGLRRLLAFNPATAVTALAVLIVCVGLFRLTSNFSGKSDVAEVVNNVEVARVVASPTAEINKGLEISRTAPNIKESVTEFPTVKSKNTVSLHRPTIKTSGGAAKNTGGDSFRTTNNFGSANKKPATVKKSAVPNFNDTGDDEDKTVRLADLFAELDSK